MKAHLTRRIPIRVAMGVVLAMLALGFLGVVGMRFLAVETASADPAKPNPGHSWTEVEVPAGTWTGLDADKVDGMNASDLTRKLQCPPRRVPVDVGGAPWGGEYTLYMWCSAFSDSVQLFQTRICADGDCRYLSCNDHDLIGDDLCQGGDDDWGCKPFCEELGFLGGGERISSLQAGYTYQWVVADMRWGKVTQLNGAAANACTCYPSP